MWHENIFKNFKIFKIQKFLNFEKFCLQIFLITCNGNARDICTLELTCFFLDVQRNESSLLYGYREMKSKRMRNY